MNRQQLRRETRDVKKSLVKAGKTKEYRDTIMFFNGLKKEDLSPLKDKTHTDIELQKKFNRYFPNMQYVVSLEKRLYELMELTVKKQDTGLVKED